MFFGAHVRSLLTGKVTKEYVASLSKDDHRVFNAAGEFFGGATPRHATHSRPSCLAGGNFDPPPNRWRGLRARAVPTACTRTLLAVANVLGERGVLCPCFVASLLQIRASRGQAWASV